MPIYEYECVKCGKKMDILQKMSDPPPRSCRYCDGPVRRIMSPTTFHLKGNGWYATDYNGNKAPVTANTSDHDSSPSAGNDSAD